MLAGILGVERAFAVGQAREKGARALLAEDIAVRQAVGFEGALDELGKPARGLAEEAVAGIDDLLQGILAVVLLCARRRGQKERQKCRNREPDCRRDQI